MRGATHRLPGLALTDHGFELPLDHDRPDGERIQVFAREAVAVERAGDDLPWLAFFQGGPGFGAPRPDWRSGWLKRALRDYRVLLLDPRGTGLSTPVTGQALARFPSPEAQADYLKHFRADAIVRDAEAIRRELVGERPWSALGQSYGGFCLLHYLSRHPGGLREALFTGGLPPLARAADEVYRATYRRVLTQNERFYARYPEDADRVRDLVDYLGGREVALPGGGRLTPRRLQQLGFAFGFRDGFETVHYLLEGAFEPAPGGRELSHAFLRSVENVQRFETNPIFALLHEAIYAQGEATNWAAERVRASFPQFDSSADPVRFTGEMIYPWMFEDYERLRPLREAAELLAAFDGWPRLYDADRLAANEVPCAAAVYADDMYVERAFSEETAASVPGMRVWLTNQHDHSALRMDGEAVLDRLLRLVRGER